MAWHCTTIPGNDRTESAAATLVSDLEAAYNAAGRPDGADVFHRRRGDGSHSFFLSPSASKMASMILLRVASTECGEPTAEDRLVRVRL